jgi:DNA invertase Pin-like site-specific DNA recombinase
MIATARQTYTETTDWVYAGGMKRTAIGPTDHAIGYIRCSTEEQGISGIGLEAQRRTILAAAAGRGWTVVHIEQDVASGKDTAHRPGLAAALAAIHRGEAGTLLVAKLDRLSRSVADFAAMLNRAQGERWNLCVVDLGADLTTPYGIAMAQQVAVFAELERRLIGERTRSALAVRKSQGVRLGRPLATIERAPVHVVTRIRDLREAGLSLAAIAAKLNDEDVPRTNGGVAWHPSSVRYILARAA